jgi:enterochelin esterase-like enzyme
MATRVQLGEQVGWHHDEGHRTGTFHTFDHLSLGHEAPPRKVHVWLPRQGVGPWPVVYALDGDAVFWPGGPFGFTWDLAGLCDEVAHDVAPVAIVAVHPHARNEDYTHVDWSGGRLPFGGLPAHATWLAQHLKPFVDAHFPVDPARSFVLGSSHGGLAAFWTATRHPRAFRGAVALSPSVFSGLDLLTHRGVEPGPHGARLASAPLLTEVDATLRDPAARPELFLSWGLRRDGGDHNRVVERLATERGRELATHLRGLGYGDALTVYEDPRGGHDEATWRRHVRAWLARRFPRGAA